MPSIGKNTPTNSSSEKVNSVGSSDESSGSEDRSYGSGDEKINMPTYDTAATEVTSSRNYTQPVHKSALKIIVGSFCALTAVGGGFLLIYGGNGLNNPNDTQKPMHQAMLGVGGAVLGFGLIFAGCYKNQHRTLI